VALRRSVPVTDLLFTMELNPQEVALVEDLRRLPRPAVEQVVALTHRLAAAAERGRVDWSDSWSEKDVREYSRASADRLPDGE